ncbi:hypothetical protein VOLCADRAFT_93140 [Volvox carteri f. nagariensis]|uniref:Uncharacterized protein n=1 Tax=Volvox carteri f. nagariensis TaxID=3068 RepID=D8U1E6_VOLCA|nr:uncharacterized protein VOLCADRAFT_93140 [Volvox carteri f. nagariensis]EFJ46326.1 hypothetical protein VOLCADRAFT_93140 [Volvox carteri f. nagariensis]|eukprot:XP_002952479.1 hypothetical protein VOLCADRAFT_93140 [Volvox carteri f. nagariensis]
MFRFSQSHSGLSDSATSGAEVYGNMTLSVDCGLIDSLGTNLAIDLRAELASAFGVSADSALITNISCNGLSGITASYMVQVPSRSNDDTSDNVTTVADAAAATASNLSSHISSEFTSQWGPVTTSHLEGIILTPTATQQQQEQKEQSPQQQSESSGFRRGYGPWFIHKVFSNHTLYSLSGLVGVMGK